MIKFGTGGWRAIIADEFTKENIRLVVAGLCKLMLLEGHEGKEICVGYDRRFLSKESAHWAAEVLAGYGFHVFVVARSSPTPLIMFTVKQMQTPYGLAVTASHTDVTLKAAGDSFRLTPKGITGVYAADYASADPAVATVAEDGTVTAVAPGTTTISIHVEGNGNQFDFTCIVRCAWKEQASGGDQAEDTGTKQSFADFFAGLQTSYEGLGAMMAYEGELLDNYYAGLSDISTKQMLVQETMMSMANCAVALVEVSDSADVEAVKTILQDRAKTQADGGAWYPASCETWEQAVIVAAGNYVGMFVYPDSAQAMADAFTAAYGG